MRAGPAVGSRRHVAMMKARLWRLLNDEVLHEFPAPPGKGGRKATPHATVDYQLELLAREQRLAEIMLWTANCQRWLKKGALCLRIGSDGCLSAEPEIAWTAPPSNAQMRAVRRDVLELVDVIAGGTQDPVDEECQNLIFRLNHVGWQGEAAMAALEGMSHMRPEGGARIDTPAGGSDLGAETLGIFTPAAGGQRVRRRL